VNDLLQHLKTAHAWHLDVEKNKVRLQFLDGREGL
jgi:hypothetical protein